MDFFIFNDEISYIKNFERQKKILKNQIIHSLEIIETKQNIYDCGGPFSDYELGYLLPCYCPKVQGKRVKTDLIATHLKPACAQTKAPFLKNLDHKPMANETITRKLW